MTHLDPRTVRAKIVGVSPIPRRVKLSGVVRGTVRWVKDFVFRCLLMGVIIFALTFRLPFAEANPDGGRVIAGQATITQTNHSRIDVIQQSNKAIIDWRSFNIESGEHTNFQQPSAAAIALNRVNGGHVSTISGLLTANGRLFLINPNGVLIGNGSRVNVGGLVATTSNITNENFMAGRYRFDKASTNPKAKIVNRGKIHIADGGTVALVAPRVRNAGLIKARLGRVALAGAKTFTLDFHGDGLLQFDVGSIVAAQPREREGEGKERPLHALVSNPGRILADGGIVSLSSRAASNVVDRVINMDGVILARSAASKDGHIILSGGENGIVSVSGSLDASRLESGQKGGTVVGPFAPIVDTNGPFFRPRDYPVLLVERPAEKTFTGDPTTSQFSNFGNEELWGE